MGRQRSESAEEQQGHDWIRGLHRNVGFVEALSTLVSAARVKPRDTGVPQLEISSTSYVGDFNLEKQLSEQGHVSLEQLSEQQQGYKKCLSDIKRQPRQIL